MNLLKIELDIDQIKESIIKGKIGVKPNDIEIDWGSNTITITPNPTLKKAWNEPYFALQLLKQSILGVVVKGYPKIKRAVVHLKEDNSSYYLMAEGTGLREILTTPGVDWRWSYSNSIIE